MLENPFAILERRLNRLEALLVEIRDAQPSKESFSGKIGGMKLAEEVTGLAAPTIYALVSKRKIPHARRGARLYFNREELVAWINEGKRTAQADAAA